MSCVLVGCGAATASGPTTPTPEPAPHVVDLTATGELTYVVWSNGRVEQWGPGARRFVFGEVGEPIRETEAFGSTVCVRGERNTIWCGPILEPVQPVAQAEGRLLVGGRPVGDHVCTDSPPSPRCFLLTSRERWDPTPISRSSLETIGRFHACGVEQGRAGCWGAGNNGAIDGVLNGDASNVPTFPPDLDRNAPRALRAGPLRTCAVLRNGELWCFGRHDGMRWPDWRSPTHTRARQVEGTYVDVFVSDHHACALDEERRPWCFGLASQGLLGPAARPDERCEFPRADAPPLLEPCTRTPAPIPLVRITTMALGGRHSCAMDEGHNVFCWGSNEQGQLGIPADSLPHYEPTLAARGARDVGNGGGS